MHITDVGCCVFGWRLTRRGIQSGTRYPLLTTVHGGPSGVFSVSFQPLSQVFAGQGYASFLPNPRGSGGYGETFRRANAKDWGYADYHDIMSGIDELISGSVQRRYCWSQIRRSASKAGSSQSPGGLSGRRTHSGR
jgi:hypothetical protein